MAVFLNDGPKPVYYRLGSRGRHYFREILPGMKAELEEQYGLNLGLKLLDEPRPIQLPEALPATERPDSEPSGDEVRDILARKVAELDKKAFDEWALKEFGIRLNRTFSKENMARQFWKEYDKRRGKPV